MNLTGNTILITGGGSGIGRGLAEVFHKHGNQVIIAGRQQEPLDEIVRNNPGMHATTLDMTDLGSVMNLAARVQDDYPNLNVLINDAGIMKFEELKSGTKILPTAEKTVETNFVGPIRVTAALMPTLSAQPKATVMTVSGGVAFVPMSVTPTYCATKAAIHSWTQSLRYQLRDTDIEVLELAPPYVQSTLLNEKGATDPHAMKMTDFIAEVMKILKSPPASGEILVEGVKALRNAEKDGKYEKVFETVNSIEL